MVGLVRRAAGLLALVALEPGITRARAAALLWPDSDNARQALRQGHPAPPVGGRGREIAYPRFRLHRHRPEVRQRPGLEDRAGLAPAERLGVQARA